MMFANIGQAIGLSSSAIAADRVGYQQVFIWIALVNILVVPVLLLVNSRKAVTSPAPTV